MRVLYMVSSPDNNSNNVIEYLLCIHSFIYFCKACLLVCKILGLYITLSIFYDHKYINLLPPHHLVPCSKFYMNECVRINIEKLSHETILCESNYLFALGLDSQQRLNLNKNHSYTTDIWKYISMKWMSYFHSHSFICLLYL